ncbi:hypothetical protein JCM10213_006544 [Rhodosporidiobolus nylandii]
MHYILRRCAYRPALRSPGAALSHSRTFSLTPAASFSASPLTRTPDDASTSATERLSLATRLRNKRAAASDPPHSPSSPSPSPVLVPDAAQIKREVNHQDHLDEKKKMWAVVKKTWKDGERKTAHQRQKMVERRRLRAKKGVKARKEGQKASAYLGTDAVPPHVTDPEVARKIAQDAGRAEKRAQSVEEAIATGLLTDKQVQDMRSKLAELEKLRVLDRPWEALSYRQRYQEVGLMKADLTAQEMKKREERGESTTWSDDTHPLLSFFGIASPAKDSLHPSFDATLSENTAPAVSESAAAAVEPAARGSSKPLPEVLKKIDNKVYAWTKERWPERQKEISERVLILSSMIGTYTAQARREAWKREQANLPPTQIPPKMPLRDWKKSMMRKITDTLEVGGRKDTGKEKASAEAEPAESGAKTEPVGKGRKGKGAGKTKESAAVGALAASLAASRELHPALQSSSYDHPPHLPRPPRDLSSYSRVLAPSSTPFTPHPSPLGEVPIATLAHDLDRVLFNPGVHFLRDPRSGVYNFDPETLENVPRVDDFAFEKLPQYVTSSKDEVLKGIVESEGRTFAGSTSSTVGMLCQIYFWLSKGKEVNLDMLSAEWQDMDRGFSMGQQIPVSVILHHDNGRYSIDADKSFDQASNILADYGHLMEKLLTTEAKEFKRFLNDAEDPAPTEADQKQAYHYALTDHLVLRSQLDAHNEHLPNKTFDLKTRGTVAIRQDRLNWEESAGYTIDRVRGAWESFEREYYDLIRSAFLKYQFQARIGHMDGVMVAYHSTARFFGFQYIPISEMDEALFGNSETGQQCFKLSLGVLETVLKEAAACYPGESVNVTWAADVSKDVLRVFVAPQKEVEALRPAKKDGEETGEEHGERAADEDVAPLDVETVKKLPMTLLEIRGTNYLDGEPQAGPILIPSSSSPPPSSTRRFQAARFPPPPSPSDSSASPPVWQVGFDITKSTGQDLDPSNAESLSADRIAALWADVRGFQTMFSSIALPTGVTVADVAAAAERAKQTGVELDPSDLSLRFPLGEGVEYKAPSRTVRSLREIAREGTKRRVEEQERQKAEHGETTRRVQVVSRIEVVEQ